jgi:hypothetical protein
LSASLSGGLFYPERRIAESPSVLHSFAFFLVDRPLAACAKKPETFVLAWLG